MDKAAPTILWDFDGTLAEGPRWSRTMLKALDRNRPGHGITREQIGTFLHEGFPWHNPEKPHPELRQPSAWWELLENVLARAYLKVGLNEGDSVQLASLAHEMMLEPGEYRTFDDTLEALRMLTAHGWQHIILSNNFPDLETILEHLPVKEYINECLSSGITGYEKPHPAAFALALERAGHPEKVWMVGDSIRADIRGAEAAGIPAILVRKTPEEPVKYFAGDLLEAAAIITGSI